MGFWVELRCDAQTSLRCWSNDNKGPMGHYPSADVLLRAIVTQARSMGWKRRKAEDGGGWECPACAKWGRQ